ncbi:MAG: hypothetical protein AB8H79_17240 [Myxococcota bacterium]
MHREYLILGGAGLVGTQVCRQIATQLDPSTIIVASLLEAEARAACEPLAAEFHGVTFSPAWGNLFVPTHMCELGRGEIIGDPARRRALLEFLYGDFEAAYASNHLVNMLREHRPEVIVDCVNTATGLSYQNVFDGAAKVLDWMTDDGMPAEGMTDLQSFLLSQSVPQLIRHVRLVQRATSELKTRVYLKVGTTGTGGMGMNIPYTHSEDKPSKVLLAKTEAGFGHTGLMFLMARTPGGPVVKEVKPAAMIGYRAVRTVAVRDKHGSNALVEPKQADAAGVVDLRQAPESYAHAGTHEVAVVDTGENGVFTRGEFAAITALGQMEYITPEEIAQVITLELKGANTGQDVISAVDGAVLNPSYKAGLLRSVALNDLKAADESSDLPSIALGRLGPPELSKLLFEAHLLKEVYGSLTGALSDEGRARTAAELAETLAASLPKSKVRSIAPSIGIPILLPDGSTILRGPRINVPEVRGNRTTVTLVADDVDRWARKGWVDLRVSNMQSWLDRFTQMVSARRELRDAGSAAADRTSYLPLDLEIGEVVAWIFNNEMGGYRIK